MALGVTVVVLPTCPMLLVDSKRVRRGRLFEALLDHLPNRIDRKGQEYAAKKVHSNNGSHGKGHQPRVPATHFEHFFDLFALDHVGRDIEEHSAHTRHRNVSEVLRNIVSEKELQARVKHKREW